MTTSYIRTYSIVRDDRGIFVTVSEEEGKSSTKYLTEEACLSAHVVYDKRTYMSGRLNHLDSAADMSTIAMDPPRQFETRRLKNRQRHPFAAFSNYPRVKLGCHDCSCWLFDRHSFWGPINGTLISLGSNPFWRRILRLWRRSLRHTFSLLLFKLFPAAPPPSRKGSRG